MVKFLHTADWQPGITRHFLADEAQARFDGARIDAVRAMGRLVRHEGFGFVVVCGDVPEPNQAGHLVASRALCGLRNTSESGPRNGSGVSRGETPTRPLPGRALTQWQGRLT